MLCERDGGRMWGVSICAPMVIGDARIELSKVPPDSFDLLVVDAFSSDAIPLHLLTEEAHRVYFRALAPDGLLLVHISNRFVDLHPVLETWRGNGHCLLSPKLVLDSWQ